MATIPDLQTSVLLDRPGKDAQVYLKRDVPVPTPSEGEVLVRIEFSGFVVLRLFSSSLWPPLGFVLTGHSTSTSTYIICQSSHPMDVHGPGHEGINTVVQLGRDVMQTGSLHLGERVVIKWVRSREPEVAWDTCEPPKSRQNFTRPAAGHIQRGPGCC